MDQAALSISGKGFAKLVPSAEGQGALRKPSQPWTAHSGDIVRTV